MNRLKFLLSAFVVAIITLGIYSCAKESNTSTQNMSTDISVETRTIGDGCKPASPDYPCSGELLFGQGIIIPSYPGCTFEVKAEYHYCIQGGVRIYSVGDVEIVSHDCIQFSIDLKAAKNNGTLDQFTYNINRQLMDAIGFKLITTTPVNPSNPSLTQRVEFIVASCNKYCYVPGKGDKFEFGHYVKRKCTDACCRRATTYRYINGTWVQDGPTTVEDLDKPFDCIDRLDQPCPANSIWQSPCFMQCR